MAEPKRFRVVARVRRVGRFLGRNFYVSALFIGFVVAGIVYANWKYDQLSTFEATTWGALAGLVFGACCGYRLYEIE